MSFNRFRPTSHFIAPHSWSNDPCGAVYVPETDDYILCYQWNPGTVQGGNCAWGMARSKDLVTWTDCPPAIWNGPEYDSKGVFSGSIVSRVVNGQTVLYLFYTSVAALPIHWSKPYIEGCESQSLAISTDYGRSWHRHDANPLLRMPPAGAATTGWRDPFVSQWPSLSSLVGEDPATNYMMLSSGQKNTGPQLQLYKSHDLVAWEHLTVLLDVDANAAISGDSALLWGVNFECASFFTLDGQEYLIVGVEEDETSKRHNGHALHWLSGQLVLHDGKARFEVRGHGMLDHGVAYAAHIFRDKDGRRLQLGWADETATQSVVSSQGWAGVITVPRELVHVTRPVSSQSVSHEWTVHPEYGTMSTLGVHPAPQVKDLRGGSQALSLDGFRGMQSTNFELEATFHSLAGTETLQIGLRESPNGSESTKLLINLAENRAIIDKSRSSAAKLGSTQPDIGVLHLLPGEDLHLRLFVDESMVEVFINDRFAMTSRIYPSGASSDRVSCNFGGLRSEHVVLQCWDRLRNAWPKRNDLEDMAITGLGQMDGQTGFEHKEPALVVLEMQPVEAS